MVRQEPPDSEPATSSAKPAQGDSFFAALRNLQVEHSALVGRDTRPVNEPVTLKAQVSLAYPAAEIAHVSQDESGKAELEVSFLGLFGASGTLPVHYTQLIIDRTRRKDFALRDFLNLFNHRWLSLFYRAWEKHSYASAFQTSASLREEDAVTRILWSLIGFGTSGQRGRLLLHEQSLLHYSGLLADRRPRQSALQDLLSEWCSIPVSVLQFHGQWLQISEQDQSRPQIGGFGLHSNNRLGIDTVVGSRVWNIENRFRIRIGPLRSTEFRQFSPVGERLNELCAVARTYIGPQLEFDVQVVVDRREVPLASLSGESRLGWNTWLGQWTSASDADDAIFEIDDACCTNTAVESK